MGFCGKARQKESPQKIGLPLDGLPLDPRGVWSCYEPRGVGSEISSRNHMMSRVREKERIYPVESFGVETGAGTGGIGGIGWDGLYSLSLSLKNQEYERTNQRTD